MINAKTAISKVNEHQSNIKREEENEVSSKIADAASKGLHRVFIKGVKPRVLKILEVMGYVITVRHDTTEIQWSEENA